MEACASPSTRARSRSVRPASAAISKGCFPPGSTRSLRIRSSCFRRGRSTCRRASPGAWRWRPLPRCPGRSGCRPPPARAARRAGADAFFGSLGILPLLSSLPGVATVHDLTPLLFPEWHSRKNRLGFNPFIGATVRRARRIVAVSDATRRDLVAAFPDAAPKTVVVHNGVEPETPAALGPAPHGGRPYVLYVGTLEPRKNVSRLVAAMESIWDRRPDFPDLVLAGGDGWGMEGFTERVARSRHAARVARVGLSRPRRAGALARGRARLRVSEPLRGLRPPAPRGDGAGHARRGLVGVVAAGSDGRRRPPARPGERPRHRRGAGKGARRRRISGGTRRRRARGARGTFTWAAAAAKTRALFEEALA